MEDRKEHQYMWTLFVFRRRPQNGTVRVRLMASLQMEYLSCILWAVSQQILKLAFGEKYLWMEESTACENPGPHLRRAVWWVLLLSLSPPFFYFQFFMVFKTLVIDGLVQEEGSHRVWKTWKNKMFWKSRGKSWNFEKSSKVMEKSRNLENLTPINQPLSIRNLALISFASHLVSCIHSNTSDYELLGEFEANPMVY